MYHTTFDTYKAASKLQSEALETMNAIEALADNGSHKAERLLEDAWIRYNRRTARTNEAAYRHWGDL